MKEQKALSTFKNGSLAADFRAQLRLGYKRKGLKDSDAKAEIIIEEVAAN